MKLKVLVAALSLSAAIGATAQGSNASLINNEQQRAIVHYPSSWIVKAGAGVALPIGNFDEKPAVFSYNLLLEYQKQINDFGLFVGGQIGISSAPEWDCNWHGEWYGDYYEGYYEGYSKSNFGGSIGPVFGLVRPINDKVDFTGHIGAIFNFDSESQAIIKPEIGLGCIRGNWMFEIVGAYCYICGIWKQTTEDRTDYDYFDGCFDLRFNIGYKF